MLTAFNMSKSKLNISKYFEKVNTYNFVTSMLIQSYQIVYDALHYNIKIYVIVVIYAIRYSIYFRES